MSNVIFGDIEFDEVSYDRDADVLYLNVAGSEPTFWEESPEGHVLRFDATRELCGITLIGVRHCLDEKGRVSITVPETVDLDSEDLDLVLA